MFWDKRAYFLWQNTRSNLRSKQNINSSSYIPHNLCIVIISVVGRALILQRCPYLNPWHLWICSLTGQMGLCTCNDAKELKMGQLSWTIWVDYLTGVLKRRGRNHQSRKKIWQQKQKLEWCHCWKGAMGLQKWEKTRCEFSPRASKRSTGLLLPWLAPSDPFWEVWPPELQQ